MQRKWLVWILTAVVIFYLPLAAVAANGYELGTDFDEDIALLLENEPHQTFTITAGTNEDIAVDPALLGSPMALYVYYDGNMNMLRLVSGRTWDDPPATLSLSELPEAAYCLTAWDGNSERILFDLRYIDESIHSTARTPPESPETRARVLLEGDMVTSPRPEPSSEEESESESSAVELSVSESTPEPSAHQPEPSSQEASSPETLPASQPEPIQPLSADSNGSSSAGLWISIAGNITLLIALIAALAFFIRRGGVKFQDNSLAELKEKNKELTRQVAELSKELDNQQEQTSTSIPFIQSAAPAPAPVSGDCTGQLWDIALRQHLSVSLIREYADNSSGRLYMSEDRLAGIRVQADELYDEAVNRLKALEVTQENASLNPEEFDLQGMLTGLIDEMAILFQGRKIEISVQPGESPLTVEADKDKIYQMLCRLISRVFPDTGRRAAGEILLSAAGANGVLIEMKNPGPGGKQFLRTMAQGKNDPDAPGPLDLRLASEILILHSGKMNARFMPEGLSVFILLPTRFRQEVEHWEEFMNPVPESEQTPEGKETLDTEPEAAAESDNSEPPHPNEE